MENFQWQNHEHTQWIVWGLLADWLILFGRYRSLSRTQWYNIHGFGMLVLNLISLLFHANSNEYNRLPNFQLGWLVTVHKLISIPTLPFSLGLVIAGFFLRYLIITVKPQCLSPRFTLNTVRQMHLIGGLSIWVNIRLMLLTGSYIYSATHSSYMFLSVVIETLVFLPLAFYLEWQYRKSFQAARLQVNLSDRYHYDSDGKEIVADLKNNALTSVELSEKYVSRRVYLFMNKVYLLPDTFVHPGGQDLLDKCKFKDITRYILGVTGLESEVSKAWTHSAAAFDQLNFKCIGDISLIHKQSSYLWNMRAQDHSVSFSRELWKMSETTKISPSTSLFMFKNEQYYLRLNLKGMAWMGKYYAITGGSGKIRLYSNCVAMSKEMRDNMDSVYSFYEKVIANPKTEEQPAPLQKVINYLPLAIKLYDNPTSFTRELHFADSSRQFLIEGPLGRGFEFRSDFSGTIAIIVGGSGFIPFVDLISYLYMKTIYAVIPEHKASTEFVKNKARFSSILPFAKIKLFAAFPRLEDFLLYDYVLKMFELNRKHGLTYFDCLIRLSSNQKIDLPTTTQKFDSAFLAEKIVDHADFVVLCGPAQMTAEIYQTLTKTLHFSTDDIVIH